MFAEIFDWPKFDENFDFDHKSVYHTFGVISFPLSARMGGICVWLILAPPSSRVDSDPLRPVDVRREMEWREDLAPDWLVLRDPFFKSSHCNLSIFVPTMAHL